ncbi:unnamed protein product [Timema podura]|uniref:Protein kinase domain-containing protein n=1 Tax=Timema podura TaxID=61482 RepID=A0ABN7NBH7_TIMPD|nr:unnamed protein product [Timema podura]
MWWADLMWPVLSFRVEMDHDGTKLLKLGDFGLAQRVSEPLYTVCGTPTYVAPEILAETGYGLKIDVWATGVILYILLCGFPPFVSATNDQEELFDKILSGRYEFSSPYWDNVSQLAKHLISHMLQVQPELRFSAEDVLDHLWLAEAGGEEQLIVRRAPNLPAKTSLETPNLTFSAVSRPQADHVIKVPKIDPPLAHTPLASLPPSTAKPLQVSFRLKWEKLDTLKKNVCPSGHATNKSLAAGVAGCSKRQSTILEMNQRAKNAKTEKTAFISDTKDEYWKVDPLEVKFVEKHTSRHKEKQD